MSNQQQQQRPLQEEAFDPSGFNFKNYLQQNMCFPMPNAMSGFSDMDTQFTQVTHNNGRYTPASNADTFRNAQLPGVGADPRTYQQFNQGNVPNTQMQRGPDQFMDRMGNGLPENQFARQGGIGGGINLDQQAFPSQLLGGQLGGSIQQQLLQLELLKMQSTPSNQNLLMQNQIPGGNQLFGAGFLNAAQLLANVQQISNNPGVQGISSPTLDQQKMNAQPLQSNALNSIYQNLNHYQTLIDSIEKSVGAQLQPNSYNVKAQPMPLQSQPSYLNQAYNPQTFSSIPTQQMAPGDTSNRYMQFQQPKQVENDPSYGLNNYLTSVRSDEQQLSNSKKPFNYEQRQTQSKERQYNPQAYQMQTNNKSFNYDLSGEQPKQQYMQGGYQDSQYQRRASPRNNTYRERENYSPQESFFKNQDPHNDSMQFLNYNPSVKQSNQVSPYRGNKREDFLGDNMLESSSFRNNRGNQNHNHSQGSNSILQEHHQNTFQNRSNHNQYSPACSNYRNDDVENSTISGRGGYHNKSKVVNIDDIPIPTTKARNFEELLEKQLGMSNGELAYQSQNEYGDNSQRGQKKEFLKRKSKKPAIAPAPTKKYNYYVDNFDENKKKEKQEATDSQKTTQDQPRIQSYEVKAAAKPNFREKEQRPQTSASQNDYLSTERQTETNATVKPVVKKKFLARGSGTAGGRKGYEKSQNRNDQQQQQNEKEQTQKNKTVSKKRPGGLSDEDNYDYQQYNTEQDTKSPRPNKNTFNQQLNMQNQQRKDQANPRNSILEFEQLEQECTQKAQAKKANQQQNKRKKKLFDDSDSDFDNDQPEQKDDNVVDDNKNFSDEVQTQQQYQTQQQPNVEEAPKSNIVKKFFCTNESTKQGSKLPQPSTVNKGDFDPYRAAYEKFAEESKEKMEAMNKAMERFHQEQSLLERKRQEYEKLIQKAQVEKREFESLKKKALDEVERLKQDEIEKIKKEKKALEQRQKNLQLVGNSNKKEREEIEALRKELQRVMEEAKAKEAKQKNTIDRLKKQVEDLTTKNKEMSDELRHMSEQLRNRDSQSIQKKDSRPATANGNQANNRYTFSTNNQQENQQPKSILKNKNDTSNSKKAFHESPYKSEDQDQDYHDEEEEEERNYHNQDYEEEKVEDNSYGVQVRNQQRQPDNTQLQQQRQQQLQQQQQQLQQQRQQQQQQTYQQQQQQQQQQRQIVSAPEPDNNEEEEEDYDMKFPPQYHNKSPSNMKVNEQIIGNDGKIQRLYENGKKEVIFNNGVKREVFPDGYTIVYFNNNDIKQTYPDQRVVYYFAEAKTTQTTFPDGLQVFKFSNNQVEKHFPDGTKEIVFPDGTIKCIFADGEEESIFPDGTIQRIEKNGVKAIEFANGQKDILFPDGTRIREFPDGRVKKTYPDGTIENSQRQ